MPQIIPAILEREFKEVSRKMKLLEGLTDWAQLDIMDGKFVKNISWNNPAELRDLETNLNIELHLMILEPEEYLEPWLEDQKVKRIIVHWEATNKLEDCINTVKETGRQIGVALNPKTPITIIQEYLPLVDSVMLLGVNPGFSGQKFEKLVLNKIRDLRMEDVNILIEVDGGVDDETAKDIVNAGADVLVAASWIWKHEDIGEAINNLKLCTT